MLELFLAELKRSWIQFLRYPTESLAGVVITTVFFYGLFLSARYIATPGAGQLPVSLGDRLNVIVVGYVLWTLVLFVMGNISGTLQSEAQTGTLEQLFLSQFGAPIVFMVRAIASLFLQIILIATILIIIILLTGSHLSFPWTLPLPLFTVLLAAYGMAFIMGALALRLKQVQQLGNILNFPLLFLLTVPIETSKGLPHILGWLLPMMPGAGLMRDLMARDNSLNWGIWAIALLNGSVYFAIGWFLFRWAERETKRSGKIGGY
ncbi:MAG: ABC transporter permease [Scytolyngbya sp. HA4215-MV1]|jgi:ABC-2 type transport system permease protein|nr:ABC transporter permease [Scytolyngbya sp. HA4215-MV1]